MSVKLYLGDCLEILPKVEGTIKQVAIDLRDTESLFDEHDWPTVQNILLQQAGKLEAVLAKLEATD